MVFSLFRDSTSTVIATWKLSSLVYRVSDIRENLRKHVDLCRQQIDRKTYQKLLHLFKEIHIDNQEVLGFLFSLKDEFPLKNGSSQTKLGVSELVNKEVVLLVSQPKILPLEELLLLVQQTQSNPQHNKLKGCYEIVWVPVPSSNKWTDAEEKDFLHLSDSLPWYSIRQPWLLSSAVVNYIKQQWRFTEKPFIMVLDSKGRVSSSIAIDMIYIWGPVAYPFSTERELELWEEASWSLQLIMGEIDPLISKRVEEGGTLFLYGSDDIEWIREFTSTIKEMKSSGVQVELVYVGKRNFSDHVTSILDIIGTERLGVGGHLSCPKMDFFWIRLESIRRSKLRLERSPDVDHILREVESLFSLDANGNSWVVIGEGPRTDVIKLQGSETMECLKSFHVWGEKIEKLGVLGAIRNAVDPLHFTEHCDRSNIIPYTQGSTEGTTVVCEQCQRPMKMMNILFRCNGIGTD
ncbi:PREDICTED: protein SIEVE ELEMENT OCCLUSION C [Nelumbo nucifera]|uniref:Protein SIEVE ELEMENT OCCLUSION C n=1 Tax=Nelumbo nucifera TaxID=4432 RepID=A0A1U7ZDT7_NELNU|nr:PREDICTED: protein SIEVE ELEMENT OCCLUSION C [Nelumbo nucifera]